MQLASTQFSPRILQDFLSTRITQWTLGLFVASFVYALTVLREVRDDADGAEAFVPQLSVTFAYVLVLAAFALFLAFIRTIMTLIQVSAVISRVGHGTLRSVEREFLDPDEDLATGEWAPVGRWREVSLDDRHGHISEIDEGRICAVASDHDLRVAMQVCPGDFVAPGTVIAQVWSDEDASEETWEDQNRSLCAGVALSPERSLMQDPAFGVRQLVDIAERALSPGINDPTTAVQVLTELRIILGEAVRRQNPPRVVLDDAGRSRVLRKVVTVEDLLRLATEEIAHYGADSVQIPQALALMLTELEEVALPQHRDALARVRAACRRTTTTTQEA
ncbi:DUF2254 domain-containing protein [Brachybacterium sp. EF45031]|uniref:DUF2254 domain-containing protein n=1 Tax=Brachybacterium sillae TaxID=2810536 RepID=UPI00217CEFEF|nr:DUF2254 domain-containing protein [Brachybacterium sillae]MCS6712001.1 DUF2254 domain-containing protein [Brachybacterium sillae]